MEWPKTFNELTGIKKNPTTPIASIVTIEVCLSLAVVLNRGYKWVVYLGTVIQFQVQVHLFIVISEKKPVKSMRKNTEER